MLTIIIGENDFRDEIIVSQLIKNDYKIFASDCFAQLDENKNYITISNVENAERIIDFYGRENCFVVHIDRSLSDTDIKSDCSLLDERIKKIRNITLHDNGNVTDIIKDLEILYDFYRRLNPTKETHYEVWFSYDVDFDTYLPQYMDRNVYERQCSYLKERRSKMA